MPQLRPLSGHPKTFRGSGSSDNNLPILLLGNGGDTLCPGRHLRFPKESRLANLHLAMLDRIGAAAESFGDSTGEQEGLA